ncbi:rhodanese-like domain-containing protein [Agromyces allii]|uniref:Rhodanese domain-containing protein n=1 Tax=Agromyces allii TaxID=393607 RepID=A0ABP5BMZ9_9MICO|nr:rhodanese-like domain-containing protein [Agromyces allii]
MGIVIASTAPPAPRRTRGTDPKDRTTMQEITPTEVNELDGVVILDVREPHELERARIDGALHIPLGELVARVDEVPRDATVYTLCHIGGRSAQAAAYLESLGIDTVNISGGIVEWHRQGMPLMLGSTE